MTDSETREIREGCLVWALPLSAIGGIVFLYVIISSLGNIGTFYNIRTNSNYNNFWQEFQTTYLKLHENKEVYLDARIKLSIQGELAEWEDIFAQDQYTAKESLPRLLGQFGMTKNAKVKVIEGDKKWIVSENGVSLYLYKDGRDLEVTANEYEQEDNRLLQVQKQNKKVLEAPMLKQYGIEADSFGTFATFIPCKPVTNTIILTSDYGVNLFIFLLMYLALRTIASWISMAASESWLHEDYFDSTPETRSIWVTSICIVFLFSLTQAYFEHSQVHIERGIGVLSLGWAGLIMTYANAIWLVFFRYIIDIIMMSKGKDPRETLIDDAIVMTLGIILFVIFSNGWLDIALDLVAGMLPFLLIKFFHSKKTKISSDYSAHCILTTAAITLVFLGLTGNLSEPLKNQVTKLRMENEHKGKVGKLTRDSIERILPEIDKRVRYAYLSGHISLVKKEDIFALSRSNQPEYRHTAAMWYAVRGNKDKAKKIAKSALDKTNQWIELVAKGVKAKDIELFLVVETTLLKRFGERGRSLLLRLEKVKNTHKLKKIAALVKTANFEAIDKELSASEKKNSKPKKRKNDR